jgi:hypothetical protein
MVPTREWRLWYDRIKEASEGTARGSDEWWGRRQADVLLTLLSELAAPPEDDTGSFRRLMVAKRHQLWRVRGADDTEAVQVRFIVWFDADSAHVLVGGNKAGLQELWYNAAGARAEAEVDAIRRGQSGQQGVEGGQR